MKIFSTKDILMKISNSGKGKELSVEDLKRLQSHLLKMYRDIESVCQRHGLKICLAYGNVIGAMRHNGWIPWDDDMDIHMSREDYNLFLSKYASELPPQYKISSYVSKGGSYARFAKVIDTSTVYVSLTEEQTDDSGIFIDIFPIDNVPNQKLLNKARRLWTHFMMFTASSVMQFQEKSEKYKALMFSSAAGKRNWYLKHCWGAVFSMVSYRTWNKWIERFGQFKNETGYCHIVASRGACFTPVPNEIYFPFREINLPDLGTVHIPNKFDEYLSMYYGDWHIIPDDSDKWRHYVSELYIPE